MVASGLLKTGNAMATDPWLGVRAAWASAKRALTMCVINSRAKDPTKFFYCYAVLFHGGLAMPNSDLLPSLLFKINENQQALEAAIMELTLWVEQRGSDEVGGNVRGALDTIRSNEVHQRDPRCADDAGMTRLRSRYRITSRRPKYLTDQQLTHTIARGDPALGGRLKITTAC